MKRLDLDKIELLKKAVFENNNTKFKSYGSITSVGAPPEGSGLPGWKEILGPDLMKYLVDNIHPYGSEITFMRANIYEEGSFFNLHLDNVYQTKENLFTGKNYNGIKHMTSIILDKSDDLIGGDIILGDVWDLCDSFDFKLNMNRIPLQVISPEIGECVYWDWNTLHGVTQIKQGTRLSLVVAKNG